MNWKALKTRVKVQLGMIVAGALAMQVDQVRGLLMPLINGHPKLVSFAGSLFTAISLLQNPAIEKMFGFDHKQKEVE